jgi:hypothetical protein
MFAFKNRLRVNLIKKKISLVLTEGTNFSKKTQLFGFLI